MEWVTIKSYELPYQAYFDRDLLEDNGIQTALQDELLAQANWLYTNAIDGIKLQVQYKDLDKARELLKENPVPVEVEHTLKKPKFNKKCPKCKSNHVYPEESPNLIFLISFFLFGIPIRIKTGKFHCYYCGNQWQS